MLSSVFSDLNSVFAKNEASIDSREFMVNKAKEKNNSDTPYIGNVYNLSNNDKLFSGAIEADKHSLHLPLKAKPMNNTRRKVLISFLENGHDFKQIDKLNIGLDSIASAAGKRMKSAIVNKDSFSNVFGNTGALIALQEIISALNSQENTLNMQAANWSQTTVELVNQAGNQSISAAEDRLIGATSSGIISLSMQGTATGFSIRALNKESKSITNNLGRSNVISRELQESQHSIQSSVDSMVHQGGALEANIQSTMSRAHPQNAYESAELRHNHMKITNNTSKVRVAADLVNQTANSVHSIALGGAETAAAEKIKEADLDRGNQTVSNNIEDSNNRVSKKFGDSESSLRQTLSAILNSTNDAVSFISGRMA
ncbi:hypothetical protein OQB17_004435 [Salmonella enterica]|nr:hypothetical protein [Salmonella enterica]